MNHEDSGWLWFIPVVVVSISIFVIVLTIVDSANVVIVLTIVDSANRSDERKELCTINGYDFVAYSSGNYYCIGNGTSKLIIRQNDKYELR